MMRTFARTVSSGLVICVLFVTPEQFAENSNVQGFTVARGETQVIIPQHEIFCATANIFVYNNGDIQVSTPPDTRGGGNVMRSRDHGRTWTESPKNHFGVQSYQFPGPDGEVVGFADMEGGHQFSSHEGEIHKISFYRSRDNGMTEIKTTATIQMPDSGTRDNFDHYVWIEHSIIRLPDGSLLAAAQGVFRAPPTKRIHAFVIRSTDGGGSWRFLSNVAFDFHSGLRGEGFDELNLLQTSQGRIVGFLRSGSGAGNPLYMTESVDGGKTWSHAEQIADHGVYPNSWLMKNGAIALVYGRPGVDLMFSRDGGETWGNKLLVYEGRGSCDCSYYSSIAETQPGMLMVVYHRTDEKDCMKSEIVGTMFKVKAESR